VRSSAHAKAIVMSRGAPPADEKLVDIWFSYLPSDIAFAHAIALALAEHGYTSAPHETLNHADAPKMRLTPKDARCVITIWTPPAIDDLQVLADARTAGHAGNLIEIAFRKACPSERFSDEALICFRRTEKIASADQWAEVLARVKRHCGPPKRALPAIAKYAPGFSLTLALAGIGAVLTMMNGGKGPTPQQNTAENWAEPSQHVAEEDYGALKKRPSLTPTSDYVIERGGPQDYIAPDTGTDPKGAPPASAPVEAAKPAPVDRGVQGPER